MEMIKNNKLVTAIILAIVAGLTVFLANYNSAEEAPAAEPAVVEPAAETEVEPAAETPTDGPSALEITVEEPAADSTVAPEAPAADAKH